MANPFPAVIRDVDGVTRLGGLVDFTDPGNRPGGGGVNVTDGATTVAGATELDFTAGATVTDLGAGHAGIAVTGAGLVPEGFAGVVNADASIALTGDGLPHSVEVITATPPAWLDNTGHILEAGLYLAFLAIGIDVAPTAPGLYIIVSEPETDTVAIPVDPFVAAGHSPTCSVVFSLATADVPDSEPTTIVMPTDATLAVSVLPSFWKLA